MSTDAALQHAYQCHQAGQLDQAAQLYRQIIEKEPRNADALHLLGLVAFTQGQPVLAIRHLHSAIECRPDAAQIHEHLAVAHQAAGQLNEAIHSFRTALRIDPQAASAQLGLGNVLRETGGTSEAEDCYRQALRLDPGMAEAHSNLGLVLQDSQRLPEALAAFQEATRLAPQSAEILLNLGNCHKVQDHLAEAVEAYVRALAVKPDFPAAHYNFGTVLQRTNNYAASAEHHRQALRLQPDYVEAINGLGVALQMMGKLDEAKACYLRALQLRPNYPIAQSNLGTVLYIQMQLNAAQIEYEKAVQLTPRDPELRVRLASCLQAQHKFDEAISCYEKAIELAPDFAEAHYHRATARLTKGDFEAAWPAYEWRLKTRSAGRCYPHPRWNGDALRGQRIVIYGEWGFGDTLHFVRYVPMVEERGGEAILAVQGGLIPLLKQSGFKQVVSLSDAVPPACDWQVPLLSLPGIFHTTLDSIPAPIPYLSADPWLAVEWQQRLQPLRGLKIGIHWHGSNTGTCDPRSIPLAAFEPLACLDSTTLISLQKIKGLNQLTEVAGRFTVVEFGPELDERHGAFMDTAAIMKNLDLVVTCDTSTAHLAGALGVPVWVALPVASEWRWLTDRDDSPWYPTMRLFRQTRAGDWSDVFRRIAVAAGRLKSESRLA